MQFIQSERLTDVLNMPRHEDTTVDSQVSATHRTQGAMPTDILDDGVTLAEKAMKLAKERGVPYESFTAFYTEEVLGDERLIVLGTSEDDAVARVEAQAKPKKRKTKR